jgi:hypothetical protein
MGCLRGLLWIVVIFVGLAVAGALLNRPSPPGSPPTSVSAPVATIDKSPALQADRKKLIEKLIEEGVFQKIEVPGSLPRLWVRTRFYAADFDQKQSFASVVYAYYFDGSDPTDFVRVLDSQSGKEVGRYSINDGGLKMW